MEYPDESLETDTAEINEQSYSCDLGKVETNVGSTILCSKYLK